MKEIDEITGDVIDLAIRIHRELGPGPLESVYEIVLAAKLESIGYAVERQRPVDIEFEGLRFPAAFRIDILVDARLILEIKSLERLNAGHAKQLLTYLRLTRQPVGLLSTSAARPSRKVSAGSSTTTTLCASAPLREPNTYWRD